VHGNADSAQAWVNAVFASAGSLRLINATPTLKYAFLSRLPNANASARRSGASACSC